MNITGRKKILFHFLGFLLGLLIGAFVVFQVLFLSKVLPHGGF